MDQSNQPPASRNPFAQTYFHGTKARLSIGEQIIPGHPCNYMDDRVLAHVYVSATITAAIWGAELAAGSAPERIYLVEATGDVEDDPNVTDKRFPGNPTMSYRSASPFTVVGEVASWIPHSQAEIQVMRDNLKKLRESGQDTIID